MGYDMIDLYGGGKYSNDFLYYYCNFCSYNTPLLALSDYFAYSDLLR